MSASGLALISTNNNALAGLNALRKAWWMRFTTRCASPDCRNDRKFWPHRIGKAAGVELDGRWYCDRTCVEPVLTARIHTLISSFQSEKPRSHRLPIGLLLVNRGVISSSQLREALQRQRAAGHGRLGDYLQQSTSLSTSQLTAALGQQWGCPVFPLETQAAPGTWSDLIPIPLLESATAVPAYASADGRILHIAFGERLDHTLLYAAEQMLSCRTHPCVSSPSAVRNHLDQFRKANSGNFISFDTVREPREITWTICNYAAELRAERIALARAASYIWVRFFRSQSSRDLLFRINLSSRSIPLENPVARPKAFAFSADGGRGGVSHAATQL